WHASGARLRCGLDGVDNGLIARAAAIIAGKMLANLFSIRRRRLLQQILRRHQHSRRTESALQCVTFPECRLQIGNLAAVRDPLDRLNRRIVRLYRKQEAGTNDIAIDADRACAAHPMFATDMRAGQLKMLAKKIRQIQARQYIRFDVLPINIQRNRNRSCHADAPTRRSGRPSSDDTQRANRTFAKCRRMAGVACWSCRGSSSSSNAENASDNTADVTATSTSLSADLASNGRSPTAKKPRRRSANRSSLTTACPARPTIA